MWAWLDFIFDLCFVDSLRAKMAMIVDLEAEPYAEDIRERAPPGLPDYDTLNGFFVVALLGILIPMALQR